MKAYKKEELPKTDVIINGEKELHDYFKSLEGKKNYSDFPEVKKNPFICLLNDELSLQWIKAGKNGYVTTSMEDYVDKSTGEMATMMSIEGGKIFYKKKTVDDNTYTKIYNKNLKELFSMSGTAIKLFGYFMSQMDFRDKEGMIYMSLDDAIVFCNYEESSRSMIYKGLTELIQHGFICKTIRPWTFYLNPKYAYNGDRTYILMEYEKESTKNNTLKLVSDNDISDESTD